MRVSSIMALAVGLSGVRAAVVPPCNACKQDECMDCMHHQETVFLGSSADMFGSHHQGGVWRLPRHRPYACHHVCTVKPHLLA